MLIDTFKYKQWADRRIIDAVSKIDRDRSPQAFAFACQQLNHMARVEELFRARLAGDPVPHASTNTEEVPELDELDQRIAASNQWFSCYLADLEPARLADIIHFTFVDGLNGSMTRQEILFHIVNHGTYHRGAIGHALDLAEAPRPADTYTLFIHAEEPLRRRSE